MSTTVRRANQRAALIQSAVHAVTVLTLGFTGGVAAILVLLTTTPILTPLTRMVAHISPGHYLFAYSAVPVLIGALLAAAMLSLLLVVAGGLRRAVVTR